MARCRRWVGGGGRILMDRFAIEGQVFGNVVDGLATLPSGLNLGIELGPKGMAERIVRGRPQNYPRRESSRPRGCASGAPSRLALA